MQSSIVHTFCCPMTEFYLCELNFNRQKKCKYKSLSEEITITTFQADITNDIIFYSICREEFIIWVLYLCQ